MAAPAAVAAAGGREWRRCMVLAQRCSSMREPTPVFLAHGLQSNFAISKPLEFAALSPAGDHPYAACLLAHSPQPPNAFLLNTLLRIHAAPAPPPPPSPSSTASSPPPPPTFALTAAANSPSLPAAANFPLPPRRRVPPRPRRQKRALLRRPFRPNRPPPNLHLRPISPPTSTPTVRRNRIQRRDLVQCIGERLRSTWIRPQGASSFPTNADRRLRKTGHLLCRDGDFCLRAVRDDAARRMDSRRRKKVENGRRRLRRHRSGRRCMRNAGVSRESCLNVRRNAP